MREPTAAYYLGVSESTFRTKVDAGVYPPPRREGGMVFWLRDDLDALIERQFGVSHASTPDAVDELEAALHQSS
jgi:predicted DNA-binding transcriptional regulator AlpA